ncbi:Steroid 17-alpha-hydroxylase/17,20 lyase [Holothuria leucospilota]|uniref:Steroid 17-alpha-hydroxylase/17,20 lyase n=1 Tax=Holothuria leucospilota TaxID=206669 RepID=A0A9Q0YKY3_HOLLE|nr:Steroid 17-alpha-hydroxylase/17,20 lyase [Holothuria leucospilota]
MLVTILMFLILALYIVFYYINEWKEFCVWKIPQGPPSLPLFGNILQLDSSAIHLCLTKMSESYGKVFSIKFGKERVIILNDAKVIKSTYNGPHVTWRPKIFSLDFFLEKGFMTCREQHEFNLHTKIMRQTFKVITRTSLCEKLHEEALSLMERFNSYQQMPFDPKEDLSLASLNILHNIAFGKRYHKDDEELRQIFQYTETIGNSITPVHPVNLLPWLQNIPNPWIHSMMKAKECRDTLLMNFYNEHKKTFQDGQIRDLVDCLIKITNEAESNGDNEALKILTPYHIIINIWTIFFAEVTQF